MNTIPNREHGNNPTGKGKHREAENRERENRKGNIGKGKPGYVKKLTQIISTCQKIDT
jgi:hypothetical protein